MDHSACERASPCEMRQPTPAERAPRAYRPVEAIVHRVMGSIPFRHFVLALVFLAVIVRLVHFQSILSTPLVTYHLTYRESDMYDFDQWARRIATGDLLGREIYQPVHQWQLVAAPLEKWVHWYGSAPVFFKAPLYPYLLALIYWLFGEALLPIVLLQILASTLGVLLLFRIGERLFDRASGFLAGLLYALYAPAIHYDMFMLRNSLIVLISLVVTWQLIEFRSHPTSKRASLLGFTMGMALLLNEGFLALPLLVAVLLAWWLRDVRRIAACGGGLLLGLAMASAPLVARNLVVGVPPLSMAVLGSAIVASSNAADVNPHFFKGIAPSFVSIMEQAGGSLVATVWACLRSFQGDIGAIALFYTRKAMGLVIPFENPDNANFYYAALKDPLLRFLPTYALLFPLSVVGIGLVARNRGTMAALFPVPLVLLMAMMIAHPNSRYRTILAVFLMPFAGVALAHAARWIKGRRFLPVAAGMAACVLMFATGEALQQWVVFKGLSADVFRYRLSEFGIGAEVYARQNRYPEAIEELLQLAQRNPDRTTRSWALLMAAEYEVREGNNAAARTLIKLALQANGDNPIFLMLVADFYWQKLTDVPQAIIYYRQAMSFQPPDGLSQVLRQRLDFLEEKQSRP